MRVGSRLGLAAVITLWAAQPALPQNAAQQGNRQVGPLEEQPAADLDQAVATSQYCFVANNKMCRYSRSNPVGGPCACNPGGPGTFQPM
jgi:hypothetical protein